MKRQPISYDEYKEDVRKIYRDMRHEEYYYSLIKEFVEGCMPDTMEEKVIYVHKNRETKIHDRAKYADSHSVPDMIIVPDIYTYEKTTNPYVVIEVKAPCITFKNEEIERYISLKVEGENLEQLQLEFEHCNYIVFTDCITWYFLKIKYL